jgi:hypothetical protein
VSRLLSLSHCHHQWLPVSEKLFKDGVDEGSCGPTSDSGRRCPQHFLQQVQWQPIPQAILPGPVLTFRGPRGKQKVGGLCSLCSHFCTRVRGGGLMLPQEGPDIWGSLPFLGPNTVTPSSSSTLRSMPNHALLHPMFHGRGGAATTTRNYIERCYHVSVRPSKKSF